LETWEKNILELQSVGTMSPQQNIGKMKWQASHQNKNLQNKMLTQWTIVLCKLQVWCNHEHDEHNNKEKKMTIGKTCFKTMKCKCDVTK
jgi:hypothetical protein